MENVTEIQSLNPFHLNLDITLNTVISPQVERVAERFS